MRIFVWIALLSFAAHAQALPTYSIDLEFQQKPSLVLKRSPSEIEDYNKWISDPTSNPPFIREVVLDFVLRQVRVFLVGSNHSSSADNDFIRKAVASFNVVAGATLFIEQGDSYSEGGGASQLLARISRDVPDLVAAVSRARQSRSSILNPDFSRNLVFGVAAREWQALGRDFINFDAASNYSDEATAFLAANLGEGVALRFLRTNLHGETFKVDEFKILIRKSFSGSFGTKSINDFTDCCGNLRELVKWIVDDNQLRNLVRERHMKSVLALSAKDGDVVIAHPAHLNNILAKER
jgi:hypothetical protein